MLSYLLCHERGHWATLALLPASCASKGPNSTYYAHRQKVFCAVEDDGFMVLQGPAAGQGGAGQGDQAGPSGQLTSANAYDQLASILRANPDASPLIAQALQNMQNSASARQGAFTEVAQDAAQGRR